MRTSLITGITAAILVTILGGFAGWYAYLRTHASSIKAADVARGFSTGTNFLGIGSGGGVSPGDIALGDAGVTSDASSTTGQASSTASRSGSTSAEAGFLSRFSTSTPPTTPRLWHAGKTPIAGFAFVTIDGHPYLRYVERATGYIFSADPWTGDAERLTNTLHPKTAEAYFSEDIILERALSDAGIETLTGVVGRTATTSAYLSTALENNITAISAHPSLGDILFVRPTPSGSDIVSSLADGSKARVVYTSPLSGWQPIRIPGHSLIVQRPSDGVPGYAFEIGKSGTRSILGGIPGLQILPRASSTALLWSSSGDGLRLYSQPNMDSTPSPISLKTVVEKCVWGPQSSSALIAYCAVPRNNVPPRFLDLWHQGAHFTSDAWWQIDASAGSSQALYATDEDIDVRDPQVDDTGTFIAFINGRDASLWVLRIVK